jgi:uncharacterized protein YgfB (UPF0149 family)
MKVKIFSHENIAVLEAKVNEFLATLTTADVKHVNTAEAETETIITVWYDDLADLARVSLGETEDAEESAHQNNVVN